MSTCIPREQLRRLLDGRLPEAEAKAAETHLESCAACQHAFEELVAEDGADLAGWVQRLAEARAGLPGETTGVFHSPSWHSLTGADSAGQRAKITFPDPPTGRGPLGRLESYHIEAELGQGAFGYVFKAYDERLGCTVAIKVLCPEVAAEARARSRFVGEARKLAAIRHDHVVTVHHVGHTPGFALPYFVMEYIDGGTLDARLEREQTLPPREAAEVVRQAACGVAAAHAAGLVHRDLKPSNILLEQATGRVRITDFGLARELDADRTLVTQPGAILGTPPYMSPEQVLANEAVGPRSDIYSLGAVLYELLTGHPPFRGTSQRILQQVVHDDPQPPRRLDDRIPRDLETICLKCLHKEPARRFASARELADRLQMFLDGRPIPDRPMGTTERLWRWGKRKPALAALSGSVAFLLLLIVGGSLLVADQARKERDRVTDLKTKSDSLWDSFLTQARAVRHGQQAGQRFKSLEALAEVARQRSSLELRNEALAFLTVTDLEKAARLAPAPGETWQGVDLAPDLSHYAYGDLHGALRVRRVADNQEVDAWPGPGDPAWVLRFSPGGRFLAAKFHPPGLENDPGRVQVHVRDLWEKKTIPVPHALAERACAFRADGRLLAVGGLNGKVYVGDLTEGGPWKFLAAVPRPTCLAFHPGGRELAVSSAATREILVLDADRGTLLERLRFPHHVEALAWHPQGKCLAAAGGKYPDAEFPIYLWDMTTPRAAGALAILDKTPWAAPTRREPRVLRGHTSEVQHLAFSHRGDLLVSSSWDETTRLWDSRTGRHLVSAPTGEVRARFGPEDQQLGTLNVNGVQTWTLADGRECRALHGHTGYKGPWGVAFSPDGRLLASAGADGVRLWDTGTAREVAHLPGVPETVTEAALFHPRTGDSVIASGDAGVQKWPLLPDPQPPGPPGTLYSEPCSKAAWSADGRLLLVTDRKGQVWSLDPDNPQAPQQIPGIAATLVALSPTGRWAAFSTTTEVHLCETGTWKHVTTLPEGRLVAAFSPDGTWLAVNADEGEAVYRLQGDSWQFSHKIPTGARAVRRPLAFAPTGNLLALTVDPRSVRLVDPATGQERATLTAPDPQVISWLCFRPDGSQLAVATEARVIHLWDLRRLRAQLAAMNLDWMD